MNGRRVVATVALITGCGGGNDGRPRTDAAPAANPPPTAAVPVDTMVLTVGEYHVWLGDGRVARDSAGASCFERSVSIQRDTMRTIVPLLYTTRPPIRLNDRSIEAELTKDCRVMAVYRVDLASGRPTKLADR